MFNRSTRIHLLTANLNFISSPSNPFNNIFMSRLTETRSLVRRVSVIKTGHVATLAMIADDALRRAEALARLAGALRALIVAGASCNNRTQASLDRPSSFPLSHHLSFITLTTINTATCERGKLRTLTRRSVEWTAVITGQTLVTVRSLGQVAARLDAHAAVWKTLTVTVALASCGDQGEQHARNELVPSDDDSDVWIHATK